MTPGSVVLRASARRDVDETVARYLEEAGAPTQSFSSSCSSSNEVALGFIDALEGAFRHIAGNPESGSPRYGHELNLPGLRSWPLKAYPHLIFYMTTSDLVDVWRVLHGRRDVPVGLRGMVPVA